MKLRSSEIFDEYVKIAEEKGIISKKEQEKALKKYKDDVYPRIGSDDISTIEALYGVKPEGDYDYEHNIMEAAHKEPVVVAPAYDKINALVENEIEGQNIRINLVMGKPTTKYITQGPKLARQELVMQLVRIANDMDNRNQEELRALADTCIEQLADANSEDEKKKF